MSSSQQKDEERCSSGAPPDYSAKLVREGAQIVKGPDLFWRSLDSDARTLDEAGGELRIMRRWNSHTPSVLSVLGGGYFLRWAGKGTVIDPGCGFLRLFRGTTNYNLDQIDMVVTTHDHLDHCQDLAALIALFREFNSWCVNSAGRPPKVWDMIVSYGVADMYTSILDHPDNAPFLFWQRVLAGETLKIQGRQEIPSFLRRASRKGLLKKEPYLRSFCSAARSSILGKYAYELFILPAYHKELLGAMTAFGVRIALKTRKAKENPPHGEVHAVPPTLVISGDTAINGAASEQATSGTELTSHYRGADLLILHVGGLEAPSAKRYKPGGHLGLQGIVEVLSNLETPPKLVVLTEWGYEFGRIGGNGRSAFVGHVVERLSALACRRGTKNHYYAAIGTKGNPPGGVAGASIPILPADIGLRISLPGLGIECSDQGFRDCRSVYAHEVMEEVEYCAM